VITYFIPYLYLFASMFKLQREPAGEEVIRVPGGKPAAHALSILGFATTLFTIALSVLPPPDEPNKPLAVFKIVGGCGALVLIGVWLYWAGKTARERSTYTGVAVFRFGLKNGKRHYVAVVFMRCASIVNSICSLVRAWKTLCPRWPAQLTFSAVERTPSSSALPTCFSPA